jgi:ubiquinone/menaquinone biosynthesis C-methylase UbiE
MRKNMREKIYSILDKPIVYKAAQCIFGPGADKNITREISALMENLPKPARDDLILDVGCGPESWLQKVSVNPVGLDLEQSYVDAYNAAGGKAHLGSADALPFDDESFEAVWCVGVFHHVPDAVVQKSLQEALRVCKKGGYVCIMDAVLPRSGMTRPIAQLLRNMDRGQFMRKEAHLKSLFPTSVEWETNRFCYAYTGLEMLSLVTVKA